MSSSFLIESLFKINLLIINQTFKQNLMVNVEFLFYIFLILKFLSTRNFVQLKFEFLVTVTPYIKLKMRHLLNNYYKLLNK